MMVYTAYRLEVFQNVRSGYRGRLVNFCSLPAGCTICRVQAHFYVEAIFYHFITLYPRYRIAVIRLTYNIIIIIQLRLSIMACKYDFPPADFSHFLSTYSAPRGLSTTVV